MSNYYWRTKDGIWYIGDRKMEYSGSMEIAYQQGVKDACETILSSTVQSVHQKLAEFHLEECDKLFKELHQLNSELENTLKEQPKPSDVLGM